MALAVGMELDFVVNRCTFPLQGRKYIKRFKFFVIYSIITHLWEDNFHLSS